MQWCILASRRAVRPFWRSGQNYLRVGNFRAATSSSPSLPVVDISPFLDPPLPAGAGAEALRQRLEHQRQTAAALDVACRGVGFFYLVGHGVPQSEIANLHSTAREFFELPQSQKEEISILRNPRGGRGYQRLGENVTSGKKDWHEAIDFYAEPGHLHLEALAKEGFLEKQDIDRMRPFAFAANQWPCSIKGFRNTMETHFQRAAGIGNALMEAMAMAFGLPEKHFETVTDRSFWCARVIGYPPLSNSTEDIGESVGEHTDYGCWTILCQDSTPGALHVRRKDGTWVVAEPMEGAFVVNLGDMLSIWTRRRFSATPHWVRHVTPGRYRTSIAFFFEPNFDAIIRPLDLALEAPQEEATFKNAASAGNPSAPLQRAFSGGDLVYGEHLFSKVSSNFDLSATP